MGRSGRKGEGRKWQKSVPVSASWLQTSTSLKLSSSAVLTEAYSHTLYWHAVPARHIHTETHTQSQTPADHHGKVGFTTPDGIAQPW